MTLLLTAAAAIIVTIVRFAAPELAAKAHLGFLALVYWGASIMWCVDGFACLLEGESFIELSDSAAMLDDALLGVCVVVLGLVVWGVICIVKRNSKKRAVA